MILIEARTDKLAAVTAIARDRDAAFRAAAKKLNLRGAIVSAEDLGDNKWRVDVNGRVMHAVLKSRSGTSRTYEDRKARGQPNVTFSLPEEVVTKIGELAEQLECSKSAVVARAVTEFAKRQK
jgi:hypothetical protein